MSVERGRLATGAALRRVKKGGDDGMFTYSTDRFGCDPRSLFFLHMSSDDCQFQGGPVFIAQVDKVSNPRLEE